MCHLHMSTNQMIDAEDSNTLPDLDPDDDDENGDGVWA